MALKDAVTLLAAAAAAASALAVAFSRDVMRAALGLLGVVLSLAVVYASLGGILVAGAQIVVYAGGVVVLFMFAMMVLEYRREGSGGRPAGRRFRPSALVAGLAIFGLLFSFAGLLEAPVRGGEAMAWRTTVASLFGPWIPLLVLAGYLLFVSLVAVTVLARREPGK